MAFHFLLHLLPVFFLLLHEIFDLILLFLVDKNQGNLGDFLTLLVYLLGVLLEDQQFIAEITATFPDIPDEVLQDGLTAPLEFVQPGRNDFFGLFQMLFEELLIKLVVLVLLELLHTLDDIIVVSNGQQHELPQHAKRLLVYSRDVVCIGGHHSPEIRELLPRGDLFHEIEKLSVKIAFKMARFRLEKDVLDLGDVVVIFDQDGLAEFALHGIMGLLHLLVLLLPLFQTVLDDELSEGRKVEIVFVQSGLLQIVFYKTESVYLLFHLFDAVDQRSHEHRLSRVLPLVYRDQVLHVLHMVELILSLLQLQLEKVDDLPCFFLYPDLDALPFGQIVEGLQHLHPFFYGHDRLKCEHYHLLIHYVQILHPDFKSVEFVMP